MFVREDVVLPPSPLVILVSFPFSSDLVANTLSSFHQDASFASSVNGFYTSNHGPFDQPHFILVPHCTHQFGARLRSIDVK